MREYYRNHRKGANPETRHCICCDKVFEIYRWSKKKYCSSRCGAIKTGRRGNCVTCNTPIWIQSYRPNQKYCSVSCGMLQRTGEKSPAWRGWLTEINKRARSTKAYIEWRLAVFKRDNYTCVECGDDRGGNLEADHIKPFAYFPELRTDVDNGRTLCSDCHKLTETWGSKVRVLAARGAFA